MTCAVVLVVLTVVDASMPIAYICICLDVALVGLYLVVVGVVFLFPLNLVSSNSANVFWAPGGGVAFVGLTNTLPARAMVV